MYKPYPKYKKSGVAWLGDVPEGWEVISLKLFTTTTKGFAFKSHDFKGAGIPIVKTTDIKNNTIKKATIFMDKEVAKKYIQVKIKTNDIILSTVGSHPRIKNSAVGQIGIVPSFHNNSLLNQNAVIFKPNKLFMLNDYFFYLLKSSIYREHLDLYAHGTANQASLSLEDMLRYKTCIPPLKEQTQIANYLDQKTKKIDTLIKKQQTLIELLKEKRQALISHVVTKGLDDSVVMKDSGVTWLGDVPEHWEVTPLRYLGKLQNGISKGKDYFGAGFPFVNYGDIYKNMALPFTVKGLAKSSKEDQHVYSVRKGDVFFTRTSETIDDIGMASTCLETIENATFSGFTIRFRQLKKVLNENFAKYYFRTGHSQSFFEEQLNLVTRASLGQDILKQLPVLIPPLKDQQKIAKHLDQKTKQIDTLIEKSTQAIELLKERRVALVSAVVTGKIMVNDE